MKYFIAQIFTLFLTITFSGAAWGEPETPVNLPKTEGSRSFDLEIDQLNSMGTKFFKQGEFERASEKFYKALNLSQQLRDPGEGIILFNFAISLHKLGRHKEAAIHFNSARRLARGNSKILNSELLNEYLCRSSLQEECGNGSDTE